MTKAEAKVWGNPKWKRVRSYETGTGPEYEVRVYEHENGATLSCDNYFGNSILNMHGRTENIEMRYELLDAYGLL